RPDPSSSPKLKPPGRTRRLVRSRISRARPGFRESSARWTISAENPAARQASAVSTSQLIPSPVRTRAFFFEVLFSFKVLILFKVLMRHSFPTRRGRVLPSTSVHAQHGARVFPSRHRGGGTELRPKTIPVRAPSRV